MTFTREKGIKCSQSKSPIRLRETGCIWCLFRSCNSTKNYSFSVILEAAQQLKQKSFPAVSVCCSWGDSVHLRIWEKKLQKKQQAEDIPRLPRAAQREEMRFYRGRKSLENQYLLWVKRPNTPKAIATLQVAHRSQQTHDNPVTNGLFDWRGMNLETSLQKVVGQETHQSQTPLFRRCFSPASKKKKKGPFASQTESGDFTAELWTSRGWARAACWGGDRLIPLLQWKQVMSGNCSKVKCQQEFLQNYEKMPQNLSRNWKFLHVTHPWFKQRGELHHCVFYIPSATHWKRLYLSIQSFDVSIDVRVKTAPSPPLTLKGLTDQRSQTSGSTDNDQKKSQTPVNHLLNMTNLQPQREETTQLKFCLPAKEED